MNAKELRKLLRLTQKGMGELIGVSQSAVSMHESGKTRYEVEKAQKLCQVARERFGVDVTLEDVYSAAPNAPSL